MPRRERPALAKRSEKLVRTAVNERTESLNALVAERFEWPASDAIEWVSPVASDSFAEYYDQSFLDRLGVAELKVPLLEFWPVSGPRWDALARTASGKLLLVEAKAYIEEGVDYGSKAGEISSRKIGAALDSAKLAFKAAADAPWPSPFYQYANRLAHLYFLRELNKLDAYLLFLYFADADPEDVPAPCTASEWRGAERLTKKCLGLGEHPYRRHVRTLIWSVPDMAAGIAS